MNYWLVKSEPNKYSWDDLVKDKETFWDGVKNYQARNNLKAMEIGDTLLYYHSNKGREIVGTAIVIKEAYQDPTTEDDRWVAVDIKPIAPLKNNVTLTQIKANEALADMALVKQSRLSVMPIKEEEYEIIIEMSKEA